MTLEEILKGENTTLPRGEVLLIAIMWCLSEKTSGEFAEFADISVEDADMLYDNILAHHDALHIANGKAPPKRRFAD